MRRGKQRRGEEEKRGEAMREKKKGEENIY